MSGSSHYYSRGLLRSSGTFTIFVLQVLVPDKDLNNINGPEKNVRGDQRWKEETPNVRGDQRCKEETPNVRGDQRGKEENPNVRGDQRCKEETPNVRGDQRCKEETPNVRRDQRCKEETPNVRGDQRCKEETPNVRGHQRCKEETPNVRGDQRGKEENPNVRDDQRCREETPSVRGDQRCQEETPNVRGDQRCKEETPNVRGDQRCKEETPTDNPPDYYSQNSEGQLSSDIRPDDHVYSIMNNAQCAVVFAALLVEEAPRQDEARMLERRSKRKRRMWTREWLQKRSDLSHMQPLRELQDKNPHDLRNYLRMSEESFKHLLEKITPLIQRKDTAMHAAIPADERLAVTLRFLATGRSLQDLHFSSAISRPLLSVLIPETCNAIFHSLRSYMQFPNTEEEWKKIASDFEQLWQFPNCGGALDGKHVRITQPPNSGSYFYNYKGYFSIILMALVNANYEFINVDVGMNGRVSDGGVLEHTLFGERLNNCDLHLPPNSETRGNLNFVFIGDEAFPLHPNLIKPFPQKSLTEERRIFNYRLSRARRVVENAFGIMANRFRVFHTPINMKLESIDSVVLACCVLHNFLRRRDALAYSPPGFMDSVGLVNGEVQLGEWHADDPAIAGLQPLGPGRNTHDAKTCRDNYCQYFNGPGAVTWQHQNL
ncbi:uncharacterized protein LOC143802895 isoform X2 [Ranitomeya variabilis]|uniref:uncharacterized protein LOC143802895 isoform X2 n=1 Tax=Ranitomeya variabilis TaxID=490064 RepID=UPI0040578A13